MRQIRASRAGKTMTHNAIPVMSSAARLSLLHGWVTSDLACPAGRPGSKALACAVSPSRTPEPHIAMVVNMSSPVKPVLASEKG